MKIDNIQYEDVLPYLKTNYLGRTYLYYKNIDSTNVEAKRLLKSNQNLNNGTLIISEYQSAGVGKFNRQWHSPENCGLWVTLILNLTNYKIDISKITLLVGAAVCSSLRRMDIAADIKWPNDIYLNNKKIGGILCERLLKHSLENNLIVGIGLNINTPHEAFPNELKNSASSLFIEKNKHYLRAEVLGTILNTLEEYIEHQKNLKNYNNIISLNRLFSNTINKNVTVLSTNNTFNAYVNNISNNGSLIVTNEQGNIEELVSGEVSIRFK